MLTIDVDRGRRRLITRWLSMMVLVLACIGGILATSAAGSTAQRSGSLKTAFGWGSNSNGQLGHGTICDFGTGQNCVVTAPAAVVGHAGDAPLSHVRALSAGTAHSLALLTGGRVRSWGDNDQGQLGNGTSAMDKDRPGAVVGPRGVGELRGVTAVAGGNVHSLAVGEGGHVWAWGDNIWGQLGDGTSTGPEHCLNAGRPPSASNVCSKVPVEVVGPGHKRHLTGVSAVAAGVDNSIAVGRDGTVWSWGLNDLGQLGDGSSTGPKTCEPYSNYGPVACSPTPVEVVGPHGTGHLSHIVAVTGGADFAVALRADGTVWAWGSDAYDALGQRQISPESCYSPFAPIAIPCSTRPVEVAGPGGEGHLGRISAIAAESSPQGLHVLALRADGTVWAWGVDDKGQLGNGVSETDSLVPVQVVGPGGHGKLTGVVGVAAGGGFSLARRADGSVWAWGLNAAGELGIGNDTGPELCTTSSYPCSTKPVQVVGPGGRGTLEHVIGLAAGQLHSLALRRTQPAH